MDKFDEVIHRTLELLGTIEEGISFIQQEILELEYEESLIIIQDIITGIESINNAITPIVSNRGDSANKTMMTLIGSFSNIIMMLKENKHENDIEIQLIKDVFPFFYQWREELETILKK